ncbi:uncharacterized protein EV420DRAFT_1558299 [Desarmillaria tabescens]|uniref:HNH nuclease domain-containing protein n=1 Tax=Armillaria tabescens TaxID=1929756 RepID=A0AA39K1G5_ARMTA|nr:uncharacterized protein EV420DRAFT_1558299 [Desarmillaria tabescens]KAK0452759.1 hypothetical protein EV420DRAFT_1558299 [Desarmillaria tabescens]
MRRSQNKSTKPFLRRVTIATEWLYDETQGYHDPSSSIQVMKRQQYICPVTGRHSTYFASKAKDPEQSFASVKSTHILRPAVTEAFNDDEKAIQILRALTGSEMDAIFNTIAIDDPSNGIGFEHNCGTSFEQFMFSLQATEVPNEYAIRTHHPSPKFVFPMPPTTDRVVFKDHSNSDPPIPIPSPRLLRLHAVVANILHASGAGQVINRFEWQHGEHGSGLLVTSGYDFETVLMSIRTRQILATDQ